MVGQVSALATQEILHEAIEAIYSASTDLSQWPNALSLIARCTADVGAILIWQRADGLFATIASPELAAAQAEYKRHWYKYDLKAQRAVARNYWLCDDVYTDLDGIDAREIESNPFYKDFLARFGLKWSAEVGVSSDSAFMAALSIQRSSSRLPFDSEERNTVGLLGRHVEHALRIGLDFIEKKVTIETLGDALRRAGIGVFTLDADDRVMFANATANALLSTTLCIVNGRLLISGEDESMSLAEASRRQSRNDREPLRQKPILVRDGNGVLTALFVSPLRVRDDLAEEFLRQSTTLVMAVTAGVGEPPEPPVLRDLLGLTLAEARVASLIAQGCSPQVAAQRLDVTRETVRTVLKKVFSKTGTGRQSQLALLVKGLALLS